jgi:hypothetical protein
LLKFHNQYFRWCYSPSGNKKSLLLPFQQHLMTAYSESIFTSVAGHVQQIALAAILQQEANRDYIPDPLATDFTRNAVSWQVVTDTAQANTESDRYGYLEISVTMPLLNDSPLRNRNDLYQRVGTINNTDIASLSLARESTYVSVGALAPDPVNPNSVPGGTYPGTSNDTLERRLAWLLSTLLAKVQYIKRWNNWAALIGTYASNNLPKYQGVIISSYHYLFDTFGINGASRRLMYLGELPTEELDSTNLDAGDYDIALQQLILDADKLIYQFVNTIDTSTEFDTLPDTGDINSAKDEEKFYDPGAESGGGGGGSNQQRDDLPPSLNSGGDGATGNETPDNSLKDC